MDVLEARKEAIEAAVSFMVRPLLDQELSLVFYDMTSIAVAGTAEVAGELRQYMVAPKKAALLASACWDCARARRACRSPSMSFPAIPWSAPLSSAWSRQWWHAFMSSG